MLRQLIPICALSVVIIAGQGFNATQADPVEAGELSSVELRSIFRTPPFNAICPLVVYDDDYTTKVNLKRRVDLPDTLSAPLSNKS